MDVYLVPTGPDRYALYCEMTAPVPAAGHAPAASWWGRVVGVFHRALAEGEQAEAAPEDTSRGWVRRAVTRRLARTVAEQRLLWHLRREEQVRLVYPDDVSGEAALAASRAVLSSDRDKHLRWTVIDGLITVASAPVALVPGPNLLAYYFIFRSVGHFLSMRGADQGLRRVRWAEEPSAALAALRAALPLDAAARGRRVEEIAETLGLKRLGAFVDQVAAR